METIFNKIISLFSIQPIDENQIIESYSEVKLKFLFKAINFPLQANDFGDILKLISDRDSLHISLIKDEDVIENFDSSRESDFTKYLESCAPSIFDGDDLEIILTVTKKNVNQTISVYYSSIFIDYLKFLNFESILEIFKNIFQISTHIVFDVQSDKFDDFKTNSFFFTSLRQGKEVDRRVIPFDRDGRLNQIKSTCYSNITTRFQFLPEDFNPITLNSQHKDLEQLFFKFTAVYSIMFLFDITNVEKNTLQFKLNGYRSFSDTININNINCASFEYYFEIYNWVYDSGNLIDKIGLARNIISLNLNTVDLLLNSSTFLAIKSGFTIYQRNNIKQYIEIRNKISDQLLDFNNRANKLIETFASGFQKSSLALVTFYASAVALKALGKSEFTNVFTLDASILSITFISCSYIYYNVSRWEVKEQKKRFVSSYINLKERYTDLLEADDIKRILNNDKEYISDIEFIDAKLSQYSKLWISLLIILFCVTVFSYFIYNSTQIFESRFFGFMFGDVCTLP